MRLNIKELLRGDGVLPFSCELDPAELEFPSILRYESPLTAKGTIRSSAGRNVSGGGRSSNDTIFSQVLRSSTGSNVSGRERPSCLS